MTGYKAIASAILAGMLKIVLTSDLHGYQPEIEPCDLLVIAGDVCPISHSNPLVHQHDPHAQRDWILTEFNDWLSEQPAKQTVWIGGNHDFGLELAGMRREIRRTFPKNTHYLHDEAIEVFGNVLYGTPWCPTLRSWAFYATDDTFKRLAADIPTDTDILVLHSPPAGCFLDNRYGAPHMMEEIIKRVKPKLVVCGHIHEGYGDHEILGVRFINASYMDINYDADKPQPPVVVELEQ